MIKLKNVVYETSNHFVLKVQHGFEVYRNELTHSVRCARIGFKGDKGLDRAIQECSKRESVNKATAQ